MFRAPPQKVYTVYSILDPDLNGEANREEYQKTLDASHLGDVSKLTEIELHNLSVAHRLDLQSKHRRILTEAGITIQDLFSDKPPQAAWEVYPRLCSLQVRSALRRVGDVTIDPDSAGYVSEDALDLLGSPDVVEEMAQYVRQIAHIHPRSGGLGGDG